MMGGKHTMCDFKAPPPVQIAPHIGTSHTGKENRVSFICSSRLFTRSPLALSTNQSRAGPRPLVSTYSKHPPIRAEQGLALWYLPTRSMGPPSPVSNQSMPLSLTSSIFSQKTTSQTLINNQCFAFHRVTVGFRV